jgi:uncharacterized protein with NAD-binding domain and iron-sulfur cluster
MPVFLPMLAGLAGYALMGNPPRRKKRRAKKAKPRRRVKSTGKWKTTTTITRTTRKVRTNPEQEYQWYLFIKDPDRWGRSWHQTNTSKLSRRKPHFDRYGLRWRRDRKTERSIGLPA